MKTSTYFQFRTGLIHLFFWSVFILFELCYLGSLRVKPEPALNYFIYYGLNLSLFYSQLWLLYRKWPMWVKLSAFLLLISGFLFLKFLANHFLDPARQSFGEELQHIRVVIIATLYRGLYFVFMATLYWAAGHLSAYERRAQDAEQQQLLLQATLEKKVAAARNAYLQQQLNPHLLFNTLNFIYNSVRQHSETGGRSVLLLAELMRFSLAGTGEDGKIKLTEELDQIANLIELNRHRYHEPLHLNAETGVFSGEQRILPLILLTLTENIFKHGNLLVPGHPAILRITADREKKLTYYSRNLKKAISDHRRIQKLGLENTRIRLDHAYGNDYQLTINDRDNLFEVKLTLPL